MCSRRSSEPCKVVPTHGLRFHRPNGGSPKNQANCIDNCEYCTKTQKKCLKVRKNAPRDAKNGLNGLKNVPGWTKMDPPGATFAHFACTFGDLGHSFTHFYSFYEIFVNNCAFF